MVHNIASLTAPLPEDIKRIVDAGNFEKAARVIKGRMETVTDPILKDRLWFELDMMMLKDRDYTLTENEAMAQIWTIIPDFTVEEFHQLEDQNRILWIYRNGARHYIHNFCATLFKNNPEIAARAVDPIERNYSYLDSVDAKMQKDGKASVRIHLRHEFKIKDAAARPGEHIVVHLPLPKMSDGVTKIEIIEPTPDKAYIASEHQLQRTVCFDTKLEENQVFAAEYIVEQTFPYTNAFEEAETAQGKAVSGGFEEFLCEEAPAITFTPYLRALTASVIGDETRPLKQAKLIYKFVTTNTRYHLMPAYNCLVNIPENCAINGQGDCGVMALLFITMCRIAGIPAAWQSGLDAEPGDCGEHDWAKFYIDGYGWLGADPSFGSSAYHHDELHRWKFSFGNLDPMRIIFNDDIQNDFDPPKKFPRNDYYDNQCGEAEYDDGQIREWDRERSFKMLDFELE